MTQSNTIIKNLTLDMNNTRTPCITLFNLSLDDYELVVKLTDGSLFHNLVKGERISFSVDGIQQAVNNVKILNPSLGQFKIKLYRTMFDLDGIADHNLSIFLHSDETYEMNVTIKVQPGRDQAQKGCPGSGSFPPPPPKPIRPGTNNACVRDAMITVQSFTEMLQLSGSSENGRTVRLSMDVNKFKSLCLSKTGNQPIILSQTMSESFTYYENNYFYCVVRLPETESCLAAIDFLIDGNIIKSFDAIDIRGGEWVPISFSYSLQYNFAKVPPTIQLTFSDTTAVQSFSEVEIGCVTDYVLNSGTLNLIVNGNFNNGLNGWTVGGSETQVFTDSYLSSSQFYEFDKENYMWKPLLFEELFPNVEFEGSGSGSDIIVDAKLDFESTNPVQNKVITQALTSKVDVEIGKGLSTNDFTSEDKTKLEGIETGATKIIVDTGSLSAESDNPVANRIVTQALTNVETKLEGKVEDVVEQVINQQLSTLSLDGGEI